MDQTEQLLEEYKLLRSELLYFMNKDTTLLTCLFSGVTSILFFAMKTKLLEGCLLAYLIIIPVCGKLAYHQKQMAKISVYISFFLEKKLEIKWETYVRNLSKQKDRPRQGKYLKFSECNMMSIASVLSYTYLVIQKDMLHECKIVFIVETIIILILFIFVIVVSRNIYNMKSFREEYEQKLRNMHLKGEKIR